jgi:hypothetical protein
MDPSEGRSDGGGLVAWPPFYCLLDGTMFVDHPGRPGPNIDVHVPSRNRAPTFTVPLKGHARNNSSTAADSTKDISFASPEPMEVRSERKKQSGVSEWNTPKRYLN